MTPEMREQLQAPSDLHGAVIQQVQPGSPADNAGLQSGDVIVEVDRKPVQNAADVQKALSSVPKGQDAAGAGVVKRWQHLPRAALRPGGWRQRYVTRGRFLLREEGRFAPTSPFFLTPSHLGTAALGCPTERSSAV